MELDLSVVFLTKCCNRLVPRELVIIGSQIRLVKSLCLELRA